MQRIFDTVKRTLEDIHCYKILQELKLENEQVMCKNITFSNVRRMNRTSFGLPKLAQLKTMTEEQKDWVLRGVFDDEDIKNINYNQLVLLFEKTCLIEYCPELWEKYADILKKLDQNLSSHIDYKIINQLRFEKFSEEDIAVLKDDEVLKFINSDFDINLVNFLAMKPENRHYYMQEYCSNLSELTDYESFGKMNPRNFENLIQVIKKRYLKDFYGSYEINYYFMEALAKEYGQKEDENLVSFVFSAFPECSLIVEEDTLSDCFIQLVNVISANKSKEELETLAHQYYQFLSPSNYYMECYRYKIILDERFIKNPNKKLIMEVLQEPQEHFKYYEKKSNILLNLSTSIPEDLQKQFATVLKEVDLEELERMITFINSCSVEQLEKEQQKFIYQFIAESSNIKLMESRIRLVLTPNFLTSSYQSMMIKRMRNVVVKEDAERINEIAEKICSTESNQKEKEQLIESLPGKEHKIDWRDYKITMFNLESLSEESLKDGFEIEKGPVKLKIFKNSTCQK